ncbi:MAG TPA: hypothetical protein VMA98_06980 [Candidatus Acidoferrales bacterium]|nr:hypothetical protein [Candidatus Acidoferrales bacterium]
MQQLKRLITLLVVALLLFGGSTTAGDSLGLGIAVTPGKFEAAIPPGTTYNVPVTVANTTSSSVHILASLADFTLSQNGNYEFEKIGTSPYSLLRWAAIRPREFDIPPGTSQQVQLTIAMPPDTNLSGEYAGVVFFQTRPERGRGGVAFSARVAAKFYITVPNTVQINGAITKMTSTKASGHQLFRVLFKNLGNAHVYLRGQVIVQKGGSVVYQVPMTDNMLVERGGERLIEVDGKALEPGSYQAIATIDYGGKTETGGEINFEVH